MKPLKEEALALVRRAGFALQFVSPRLKNDKNSVKSLEQANGSLLVCAFFLREEPFERWDIVISASWLNPKERESYKEVSSKLQEFLTDEELLQFSRIVILDQNDPVVTYLLELKSIENGGYEELDKDELTDKFKFTIKRAYLLR